jgi:two-component system LytT family sensor kinase
LESPAEVHRNSLKDPDAPGERPVNWWKVAPLIWAVPATIATLQQAATYATRGMLGREWLVAVLQFPRYMLWAPFTPLIVGAARRWPLQRPGLAINILRHAALALLCIAFVEGISTQLLLGLDAMVNVRPPEDRPPLVVATLTAILTRVLTGLVTYAAVVAITMAMDSRRRLREAAVRRADLERDLAMVQVQSIKMQVQPHFLFNTLHAVNVLIERDPQVASRMITRLGDLLRHTLSRAAVAEVPLREELEVLRLYLEIEQTRFRDRLTVNVAVDDDVLDALVPDLILQPLAENAIKHGIGRDTGSGSITLRARRDGTMLDLSMTDSGTGPLPAEPTSGIGLSTVRGRLERLYGDKQSFTLGSNGAGCIARIRLPLRVQDD